MNCALCNNSVKALHFHFPGISYVGNTVQTHSYEFRVVGNATLKRLTNHHSNHAHSLHAKNQRLR
jgi:hypothetical protein